MRYTCSHSRTYSGGATGGNYACSGDHKLLVLTSRFHHFIHTRSFGWKPQPFAHITQYSLTNNPCVNDNAKFPYYRSCINPPVGVNWGRVRVGLLYELTAVIL